MFWAYRMRDEIIARYQPVIKRGEPLIIRDEKTMSGRVHIGSLRGVVIHGVISEVLKEKKIKNQYLFEINDFDPMDGLPVYVDQERFRPYMGKLLCDVPSPDGKAKNFADYWAREFLGIIATLGFSPKPYYSSDEYRAGAYNETIRLALDNAAAIRAIYKEVSGSVKDADWYPLQVVCESCGTVGTTKVNGWDGNKVTYRCEEALVKWAAGCGHSGTVSPFDGRGKLPWKVEWAAKFKVHGVHIEGGGKDHYTKGGARQIAARICKEIFKYEPPYDIPYNFFVVGGKKMSSSKGMGSSSKEIADLLPPRLLRFLMLREPSKEIDFDPYGDTIPILYDTFDTYARAFFEKKDDDFAALFPYAFPAGERAKLKKIFLPRFSQIAYLSQMPHITLDQAVAEMKGSKLTAAERTEMNARFTRALGWLEKYGPEKYKLTIQTELPEQTKSFSPLQKKALASILQYMRENKKFSGAELHEKIHAIKSELGIPPVELFSALYLTFLAKTSGPQAGWFLTALPREFVLNRLEEVSKLK